MSGFLAALPLIGKVIDKIIPDPAQKAEAQFKLMQLAQNGELAELEASAGIVKAEASSEHWLTSTWRPALMYTFITIIANNFLLAPYVELFFNVDVALTIPDQAWTLLNIGVGGYLGSRGVEKVVNKIKQK